VAGEVVMLWWPMLVVAVLVLLLVSVLWLAALRRRPRQLGAEEEGRLARRWLVAGGLLLPSLSVAALLGFGIPAGQRMLMAGAETPLRIEVTAHQWRWEVRYPERGVVIVDRMHLPAGRPVEIHLASADVIHSFWVPRLGRKLDAIPGRIQILRLQAERIGSMRGQCSEYCGTGHARMVLQVEVQSAADFSAWLDQIVAAGAPPASMAARPAAAAPEAGR
jgi:cytochrome c oxidase subunit 2